MKKILPITLAILLFAPALVSAETDAVRGPKNVPEKPPVEVTNKKNDKALGERSFASSTEERELRKEERLEKRAERKEMIKAKISEKMAFAFERVFENMQKAAERLESHSETLALRISEFESRKAIDLSAAKEELEEAEDLISDLPEAIEDASQKVSDILTGENPGSKKDEIRAIMSEIKTDLKEAHLSLVEAIRQIKSSVGEKEGRATTTENNNN